MAWNGDLALEAASFLKDKLKAEKCAEIEFEKILRRGERSWICSLNLCPFSREGERYGIG